jgi:hypothetical protein
LKGNNINIKESHNNMKIINISVKGNNNVKKKMSKEMVIVMKGSINNVKW